MRGSDVDALRGPARARARHFFTVDLFDDDKAEQHQLANACAAGLVFEAKLYLALLASHAHQLAVVNQAVDAPAYASQALVAPTVCGCLAGLRTSYVSRSVGVIGHRHVLRHCSFFQIQIRRCFSRVRSSMASAHRSSWFSMLRRSSPLRVLGVRLTRLRSSDTVSVKRPASLRMACSSRASGKQPCTRQWCHSPRSQPCSAACKPASQQIILSARSTRSGAQVSIGDCRAGRVAAIWVMLRCLRARSQASMHSLGSGKLLCVRVLTMWRAAVSISEGR